MLTFAKYIIRLELMLRMLWLVESTRRFFAMVVGFKWGVRQRQFAVLCMLVQCFCFPLVWLLLLVALSGALNLNCNEFFCRCCRFVIVGGSFACIAALICNSLTTMCGFDHYFSIPFFSLSQSNDFLSHSIHFS